MDAEKIDIDSRICWIADNGSKILYINFTGLNNDGIKLICKNCESYYENQPPNSVLSLLDLSNTYVTGSTFEAMKEIDKKIAGIEKKSACVGLSTAKKKMLNLINMFSKSENKAFYTKEEAIKWLIK